ncbi:MAG: DUF87 domain-containing protein [Aquificae bacterium]|nr:DUF87 domain-containing protein [Aquificota bacterium]
MEVLTSDRIYEKLEELIRGCGRSVKLASAWIKGSYFERLLALLEGKGVEFEVVLRASEFRDMLITDERAFRAIKRVNGKVYLSPRLHAKLLIVDDEKVVVGSANFTDPGLSDASEGNVEAGVFYDSADDPEKVKEAVEYFEEIKRNYAERFDGQLVGFALNPTAADGFEFVLVDDAVAVGEFVEVRQGGEVYLGRVTSVLAYDTGFFANPFTANESPLFAPLEDFKKIFAGRHEPEWVKAAAYAYLKGNGGTVRIAVAELVGRVVNGRLEPCLRPFDVGAPVYRAEGLSSVLKLDSSGRPMGRPIKVGRLRGSSAEAFVDAGHFLRTHLLVVGTTGSGKSYFTKRLVNELLKSVENLRIFVLDPHGEYAQEVPEAERLALPDALLPVYPEELEELIASLGFSQLVRGNAKESRANRDLIARWVKPSLRLTGFREGELAELLNRISPELLREAEAVYGEAVSGQKELVRLLEEALGSEAGCVILDLNAVTDARARTNAAGLFLQELFIKQRKSQNLKSLVILEEAHSFAPERGYGDASAGQDNLALVYARKIASEGRKFGLGVVTVTQRPAQVSKFVLSQMNTQVMFKTSNPSDAAVLASFLEHAYAGLEEELKRLPVGTCLISGRGVPFTLTVEVQ